MPYYALFYDVVDDFIARHICTLRAAIDAQ
jgi:hypothetical protein